MKKPKLIMLLVALALSACTKDGVAPPETDGVAVDKAVKAIAVGKRVLKAGYGYNTLSTETFDSPIEKVFNKVARTNSFPKGTEILVEGVRTEKSIEKLLQRESGFGVSVAIPGAAVGLPAVGAFSLSFSTRKFISEKIEEGSDKESVIVRATVPLRKFEILQKRPKYSQLAKEDLKNDGVENFMNIYGPSWVSAEVSAVEVIHVFNFDFSSLTTEEKKDAATIIGFAVKPYFGIERETRLTKEEKSIVRRSFSKQEVMVNLIGFAPRLFANNNVDKIFENGGYRKELNRMIQYANRNPLKVKPFLQVLKPHVDPETDNPKKGPINNVFQNTYRKTLRCTAHLNKWSELQARLILVAKKSDDVQMRVKARAALAEVEQQIFKSLACDQSRPPAKNAYKNIRL